MRPDEARRPGCPKHMVYGPCGGVRPDGACEVDADLPCVFADPTGPAPPAGAAAPGPPNRPGVDLRVVTDLHVAPRDRSSVETFASLIGDSCDAVLVPDHGARHGDFPPTYLASLLLARGLRPWVTLACRDRNRAALAAECAALADLGVAGVHCVTGDWQRTGEAQVFDLDALRLVEIAAGRGLAVSVAATPAAPPVRERPRLLADKCSAGATVCFVNHCGGPAVVGPFVAAAAEAGAAMQVVACVPVVSGPASAARLAALPGLVLDPVPVAEELPAADPAGDRGDPGSARPRPDPVPGAVRAAAAMLAVRGVDGVNLSGFASEESVAASARVMALVGREVRSLVQA